MTTLPLAVLRHVFGYGVLLPFLLALTAVQALVVVPLSGDRSVIPRFIFRACTWIFGIRFRLNLASASFDPGRLTMFVGNHLARVDFGALPLFPDAALMMQAEFFRVPVAGKVVETFANSAGIIGTDQSPEGKGRDLEKLAATVRAGRNLILFPEGLKTDGKRVLRYSRGAAEIFYDPELAEAAPAIREARLQPFVLRVAEVNGQPVLDQPDAWEAYTITRRDTGVFPSLSRRTAVRSVLVDVLVCPPLDPADYPDAAALMNAAQEVARSIVAPAQTHTLTRREWRARIAARDFSV